MPVVNLPLPETYVNVTRPVNLNITEQLRRICGINDKDFRVTYHGTVGVTKTEGSAIGTANTYDHGDLKFTNSGKFKITVNETYSELEQHLGKSRTVQRPPIFKDAALGVFLEPQYQQMETSIDVTYRSPDFNAASAFSDHFRTRMDQDLAHNTHELEYDYPMSKEAIVILKKIHDLREAQGGYGDTWRDWFYDCTPAHIDVLTKLDGTGGLVSFAERQVNVMGWTDSVMPPEPQKGDAGEYTVTFVYKYRYDRPVSMRFIYPLLVHNSIMPANLRPSYPETRYIAMQGYRSYQEYNYDAIRRKDIIWDEYLNGIKIPRYDDYRLYDPREDRKDLLRALICVDPATPRALLNLNELGAYSLSETLLHHLIANRTHITTPYNDIFTLELYRNGSRLGPAALELLEDGSVQAAMDLSVRDTYHIKLVMLLDIGKLSNVGLGNMSNSPDMAIDVLEGLGVPEDKLPYVISNRLVPEKDIIALIPTIKAVIKGKGKLTPLAYNLIARFTIHTHTEQKHATIR